MKTFTVSLPPERVGGLHLPSVVRATRRLSFDGPKRVAIVGSREASDESLAFASSLAGILASRGVIVVSGGAVGVDAAAHEGALRAGGATWVVLPTGYPHVFPLQNQELFESIRESRGAILWALHDGVLPLRGHFLTRNGVLASLATAVVVVAAGLKSGARNAAGWARKLGRPLYVVAGPPWLPGLTGGTLELSAGAHPVLGMDSLVKDLLGSNPRRRIEARFRYIFQHLGSELVHFDSLAHQTGAQASKLRADLTDLVLRGQVLEIDGCYKVSTH